MLLGRGSWGQEGLGLRDVLGVAVLGIASVECFLGFGGTGVFLFSASKALNSTRRSEQPPPPPPKKKERGILIPQTLNPKP